MHHIKQRRVIFVNKDNNRLSRLSVSRFNQMGQASIDIDKVRLNPIFVLFLLQKEIQISFKFLLVHVLPHA